MGRMGWVGWDGSDGMGGRRLFYFLEGWKVWERYEIFSRYGARSGGTIDRYFVQYRIPGREEYGTSQ